MPIMLTNRPEPDRVILGPCPGCDLWTLEYPPGVLPADELTLVIEEALEGHLDECPGLQEVVDTL